MPTSARRFEWVGALFVLALAACGDGTSAGDAATEDAGRRPRHDAGPPISPGVDAGPRRDAGALPSGDAGAPADVSCPAGAVLCESFEDGPLDPARWRVSADDGVFTIEDGVAADGSHALHMRYGAPFGALGGQTIDALDVPAPDDRVYVRAYLRFADLSLPGAHPFFITAFDGTGWAAFGSIINDFAFMVVGNGLDNPRIWYDEPGYYHESFEDGDMHPESENGLLAGEWICVEMMVFGGDGDNDAEEGRVYINGVDIEEMHATDASWGGDDRWSPDYDGITWQLGVTSFGPDNVGLEIWYDAIVIAHERIGCLP